MPKLKDIMITVPARPLRDDKGGAKLHLGIAHCTVSREEEDRGEITGCVGTGVELQHVDDKHAGFGGVYYIDPRDLWDAFEKAREERDGEEGES